MDRRAFLQAAAAAAATGAVARAADSAGPDALVGPMLGHVDAQSACIWLRAPQGEPVRLTVEATLGGEVVFDATAQPGPQRDFCLTWRVGSLRPDTEYRYRLRGMSEPLGPAGGWLFRTPPAAEKPQRTVLALGSCAATDAFGDVWRRMVSEGCQGIVLLGDTPYIDSSDRERNRAAHRRFLAQDGLAELLPTHPVWGTWDDHDFGGNSSNALKVDRETIRDVFTEYRALWEFGDGREGIYTHFRRGPLEVFLLDARYFSEAEPSPVDAERTTLLGRTQWNWLRARLRASTAPFKVLATGLVWHHKPNKETDKWSLYPHERDALFRLIAAERIAGVVLVSGDIHASCLLAYPQADSYPLHELVVSPLHDRILPQLIPRDEPGLVWAEAKPNVFLRLEADSTADPPRLSAAWVHVDGSRIHQRTFDLAELTRGG